VTGIPWDVDPGIDANGGDPSPDVNTLHQRDRRPAVADVNRPHQRGRAAPRARRRVGGI
jgi:hypothetical protein